MSRLPILGTIIRRSGGHVLEATVIPTALFYAAMRAAGMTAAFVCALVWSYGAVGRRVFRGRHLPTILLLGTLGLTVRTGFAVASGSAFVYFLQPIIGTVALAATFLISMLVGRPIIGRLAGEFWPIPSDVMVRPGVTKLFRRLTVVWAAVNAASAAATLTLLLCLPTGTFLLVKQGASMLITAAGVTLTIDLSLRTARREGLVGIPVPA